MYDLSEETEYLTKEGINKQKNTLNLHVKADNIFKLSNRYNMSSDYNINNIINEFENLNNELVLSDDSSSAAFTTLEGDYTSCIYDINAKTYTFGSKETIFIKDIANAEDTTQTFTSYNSVLEGGKYVNTVEYTLKYNDNLSITNSDGTTVYVQAWYISDTTDKIYSYTTNDILTVESPTWVSLVEFPSSSEEEVIEESSSSEEEVIGE